MREIVFDTETTGLNPAEGDKIVDIGAIELIDRMPTGRRFQRYINPLRSLSDEVVKIHGLTEEFLSDKPTFEEICHDFLDFIGTDSMLVAHNAPFDMKFLNYELKQAGCDELDMNRAIDTVVLAHKMFPGSRVNLDELCRRFHIDNSNRTLHGALLDAELLVEVYLELLGGREPDLLLNKALPEEDMDTIYAAKQVRPARLFPVSDEEKKAHESFLEKITDPLWKKEDAV